MPKYTRKLQFSTKEKKKIMERDYGTCLFCNLDFHMESTTQMGYDVKDIMHFIPKSDMGLGIEQNGVVGCRYHHMLLDNGNKGLRDQMLGFMKEHLQAHYKDWNEKNLRYSKWD